MQKIKLRAYNEKTKNFVYCEIEQKSLLPFKVTGIDFKPGEMVTTKDLSEWMMMIGTDKQGREMYEGDVVEAETQNEFGSFTKDLGIIFYDTQQHAFVGKHLKNPDWASFLADKSGLIVGNIYQNPDMKK